MKTRRQIFDTKQQPVARDLVPTSVTFKIDRKTRRMTTLPPNEKMIVALRKVLSTMSNRDTNGCRYYLDGKSVQVIRPVTTTSGRPGEAQNYRAAGRCKVGVCHPQGHKSSIMIQFTLSFKDVLDDRGLPDVMFFDPTSIDELPRDTPLNVSALA